MKRKELMRQVYNRTYDAIRDAVLAGYDYIDIEVEVNSGIVQVEIHEVPGYYEIADVQVYVLHDDCTKHSPLLEKAIIDSLPDWYKIWHEINDYPYYDQQSA